MVFQLLQWEGHGAGGVGTSCWLLGTHRVVGGVVLVLSLPRAVIGTGYNQHRQFPRGSSVRKALQGEQVMYHTVQEEECNHGTPTL